MKTSPQLRLSLVQTTLIWENPKANLENFESLLLPLKGQTDLVILPEMFNTGFSMDSLKLAEPANGLTFSWMQKMAKELNAALVGSVITEENGAFFNRLFWVEPDGNSDFYNKRHLFRMAGEHEHFAAGNKRLIVEYKGFKIMPLVCYDLRYPVWSRNQNKVNETRTEVKPEYDLMIYVANWPKPRTATWSSLLVARAIENQAFVAGVNRVGEDGNGIEYDGASALIDPKGDVISNFQLGEEAIKTFTIKLDDLNAFREKFPVGLDSDGFEIY